MCEKKKKKKKRERTSNIQTEDLILSFYGWLRRLRGIIRDVRWVDSGYGSFGRVT